MKRRQRGNEENDESDDEVHETDSLENAGSPHLLHISEGQRETVAVLIADSSPDVDDDDAKKDEFRHSDECFPNDRKSRRLLGDH